MLTVYGPARSRASRALWMLEECGVPYEHEDLTRYPTMEEKSAAVRQINPIGKIPVLRDDDFVLAESMAINLYLAQHYGGAFWPADPQKQAKITQWSFFAVTEVDPPLVQLMVERSFRKENERNADNEKRSAEQIKRPMNTLNDRLAESPWLLGDEFSVADLNVASVLSMLPFAKIDMSEYPNVQRWLERCHERPAYRRATAPKS